MESGLKSADLLSRLLKFEVSFVEEFDCLILVSYNFFQFLHLLLLAFEAVY